MNGHHAMILLGLIGIVSALAASGQPTTGAGGFTELHRAEIADSGTLEVVMGIIERPGESIGGKHYHPGGEFGFVLEGTVTIERGGEPETTLNAGTSFYQPPGEWHAVSTTAEGAKTVVFRVLKKGQPMVVAVD